jgi:hypothetical protein
VGKGISKGTGMRYLDGIVGHMGSVTECVHYLIHKGTIGDIRGRNVDKDPFK